MVFIAVPAPLKLKSLQLQHGSCRGAKPRSQAKLEELTRRRVQSSRAGEHPLTLTKVPYSSSVPYRPQIHITNFPFFLFNFLTFPLK